MPCPTVCPSSIPDSLREALLQPPAGLLLGLFKPCTRGERTQRAGGRGAQTRTTSRACICVLLVCAPLFCCMAAAGAGAACAGEPLFSSLTKRVILHIDMDCFYAQVEHVRVGIPRDEPLAVQQWDGLIAVNYAARAKGVTRHMRVAEAKMKCPELHCVHVEVLYGEQAGEEGDEEKSAPGSAHGASEERRPDRSEGKVSLDRYRR